MKKLLVLLASFSLSSCLPNLTPTLAKPVPEKIIVTYPYVIESSHGIKLKIEVDELRSFIGNMGEGNGCGARYIITNVGTKDYIRDEVFTIGTQKHEFDPSLVFEFTTSDGKKIEVPETLMKNILAGKSTPQERVNVNVGSRTCVGEVKPIRIQYRNN